MGGSWRYQAKHVGIWGRWAGVATSLKLLLCAPVFRCFWFSSWGRYILEMLLLRFGANGKIWWLEVWFCHCTVHTAIQAVRIRSSDHGSSQKEDTDRIFSILGEEVSWGYRSILVCASDSSKDLSSALDLCFWWILFAGSIQHSTLSLSLSLSPWPNPNFPSALGAGWAKNCVTVRLIVSIDQ